jgi:hypothetical protein
MNTEDAIAIIKAISESLRNDPTQFHYQVSVTGLKAVASAPGSTGVKVSVTGGGTGPTTGIHIQMDAGQIDLARRTVDQAIQQDIVRAIALLEDLASEIENDGKDRGKLQRTVEALRQTVLTPALQAAVFAVVQATLGKVW